MKRLLTLPRSELERSIRRITSRSSGRGLRWREVAVAGAALIMLAVVLERALPGPPARPSRVESARAASVRFLDRYMDADGRVVRRDQGGDTVSEGQAYGLLLTAAIGDRVRFERAWSWTRTHLQREDGLLAWRWDHGHVAGWNAASDADVDAAHALVVAARRFGRTDYAEQGAHIARAVLANETVDLAGERLVVAGPWARSTPYVVNPSYFAPTAFAALATATGDGRWTTLRRSSYELVRRLTTDPPALPPDWAEVDAAGQVRPIGSPSDREGRPSYGFDAARLPARLATDCAGSGRELVRTVGRLVPGQGDRVVAVYDLHARQVVNYEHPLGYVAAAAVAAAEGDRRSGDRLLARAEQIDRVHPTYYGAAWVALGRVTLTTSLLDGCGAGGA